MNLNKYSQYLFFVVVGFMLCCFLCTIEAVKQSYWKQTKQTKSSTLLKIRQTPSQTFSSGSITQIWGHCNCTPGKCLLKISLKYFPKHSARLVQKKGAFGQIQSVLGKATLYSRKSLEISIPRSLEHKSKVGQKSCCNDLCQVAVLKELVDGTLGRDFTKVSNASVWG